VQAQKNTDTAIAVRAMFAIVAVVFVTTLIVLALLPVFGMGEVPLSAILVGSVVLALLVAPPVYWLVLLPLHREYERRLQAEARAEDMSQLAITDPLTRIMNRRGITVALLDSMAQSERYRAPLTVAMADIDHFKKINDTRGHEAGDRILAEVAGVLSEELRMPDKVARYGGEEFLILFPHTSLAQARKIADRIRAAVGKHRFELDGTRFPLTISLGVAQFQRGEDLEKLMSRVDRALYDAKEAGRNRVATARTQRTA
jgi:diguanylate cyclase (GGDEF)-like protein